MTCFSICPVNGPHGDGEELLNLAVYGMLQLEKVCEEFMKFHQMSFFDLVLQLSKAIIPQFHEYNSIYKISRNLEILQIYLLLSQDLKELQI